MKNGDFPMKHGDFQIVIFHSHVSLPEGKSMGIKQDPKLEVPTICKA